MITDYANRISQSNRIIPNISRSANRNFYRLQKTELESDKEDQQSFQLAENMIHKGGNAESRRGYDILATDSDVLGISMYEELNSNHLYVTRKDGASNSKISEINRTTGSFTDKVTGRTGQGTPSSAFVSGWYYWTNGGGNIVAYESSTSTTNTTLTQSGEQSKMLCSTGTRLWAVFDAALLGTQLLRGSVFKQNGRVDSFSDSGTAITRGFIASSVITSFTALASAGDYVIACSKNRTEIHKVPDFAGNGVTTWEAGVSTLVHYFENVGVLSSGGLYVVDKNVYLNTADGNLVRINVETGALKKYASNLRQFKDYDHSNSAIGYDQKRNILVIMCTDISVNDVGIAFNIKEENFSLFTNINALGWCQDRENLYFYNNQGVFKAFEETQYDDNGFSIPIKIRTQAWEFSTYHCIHRSFLNIQYEEEIDISVKGYINRRVNGSFSADYVSTLSLEYDPSYLSGYEQGYGVGEWGGAGINPEFSPVSETKRTLDFLNIYAERFELEFSCSITKPFAIRGIGIYSLPTARPVNNINYV